MLFIKLNALNVMNDGLKEPNLQKCWSCYWISLYSKQHLMMSFSTELWIQVHRVRAQSTLTHHVQCIFMVNLFIHICIYFPFQLQLCILCSYVHIFPKKFKNSCEFFVIKSRLSLFKQTPKPNTIHTDTHTHMADMGVWNFKNQLNVRF